jgi:1-acyl-sn-glycerol-3-phosphate acyltransferase
MGLASRAFYNFWKLLFTLIFRVAFSTRIIGRERIPRTGPLVLVCNHISFVDPPLLGVATPRPVQFMAMVELFRHPIMTKLLRAVGTFPVDRARVDHRAAREAIRRLRAGGCIAIFPEGGIRITEKSVLGGDPVLKPGAETLAMLSNAAVLPVIIRGSRKPYNWRNWLKRETIGLSFGYPFCILKLATEPATLIREQLLKTVELD